VEGVPPVPGPAPPPAQKAQLGGFDLVLQASRDRILPGEENEVIVAWKAREAGARAKVQLFMEVPAELQVQGEAQTKPQEWGASGGDGEVRFRVTGVEPGGVWVEALLTLEDDMGAVLARAKAGFGVARHRVVIAGVEVEPPVVAAGQSFSVKARYAWTGQSRVRGTLGGALRRREDGAELELTREKVSALGEREQEWKVKAPVDAAVADYDVELSFEGKEAGARAQFGKTGALAVRKLRDAEAVSLVPAKLKWGADAGEAVKGVVRNTGVEALEGEATLEVSVRLPGAAEPVIVARAAEPERVALRVEPSGSVEAAFVVKLPRGVEGRRVEGRLIATFGATVAERREVLGHVVADHVLEFDGFAADKYAYGAGDEARIECRVRDDGARPGGRFEVALRLKAGAREIAAGSAVIDMTGAAAPLKAVLKLPQTLEAKGALDLEVSVKEAGAVRRLEGFLRLRQPVATRVVVVKPAAAHGQAAYLFDGEAVAETVELGEVEGVGRAKLVITDEPGYFVEVDGAPVADGDGAALERAAAKAVAAQAGAPPVVGHKEEWRKLLGTFSRGKKRDASGPTGGPSDLQERMAMGAMLSASGSASGALRRAIHDTELAFDQGRIPPGEVAASWLGAAEAAAKSQRERPAALARVARTLEAAREVEGNAIARWTTGGLSAKELRALAEAAVWRRALESELMALALDADGHDRVVQLSGALKGGQERLRDVVRYYARALGSAAAVAARARDEGADRRRLAALRAAKVEVKGAEGIVPGAYNELFVEVSLPALAPAGGVVEAAVSLPSQLWIVASEGARLVRGHYLLKGAPLKPGGKLSWKVDLYVPERVGEEPGAIEVRVGFAEGAP
jgi:hypothetical protein